MAKILLHPIGRELDAVLGESEAEVNRTYNAAKDDELAEKLAATHAGWGDKYVSRVHAKGKLTAWERIERLKDEVRAGRTPRNAAPRSFQSTWRTILTADLVSVMASAILFWLSVGSVKGFALYLGLTTLADLAVCYLFTRPAVILMASRHRDGRLVGLGARA